MTELKSTYKRTVLSTICLVIVFFTLLLLKYFLMQLGAWLSGFEGALSFDNLAVSAVNDKWKIADVFLIYLSPYTAYLIFYSLLNNNRQFPLKLPLFYQFLQSWGYFMLLIFLFFMPLVEIINKSGIYYPFIWLQTNYIVQLTFAVVLVMFFLYRSVNISQLFSTTLSVKPSGNISMKQILIQLVFIWYIPMIILLLIVLLLSNFHPAMEMVYVFGGMMVLVGINTFITLKYDIVIGASRVIWLTP